jgi:hypothetical protein
MEVNTAINSLPISIDAKNALADAINNGGSTIQSSEIKSVEPTSYLKDDADTDDIIYTVNKIIDKLYECGIFTPQPR